MIVIEQPREVGQPRRKVWCNKTDLTAQGEGYVFNDLPQDALGFGSIVFVVDEPGLVLWYDSENGEMYERVLGSGGGPSVTVEPLTVTENGTYTAEEGAAYSPVTVNVQSDTPGPYALKSVDVYGHPGYYNETEREALRNVFFSARNAGHAGIMEQIDKILKAILNYAVGRDATLDSLLRAYQVDMDNSAVCNTYFVIYFMETFGDMSTKEIIGALSSNVNSAISNLASLVPQHSISSTFAEEMATMFFWLFVLLSYGNTTPGLNDNGVQSLLYDSFTAQGALVFPEMRQKIASNVNLTQLQDYIDHGSPFDHVTILGDVVGFLCYLRLIRYNVYTIFSNYSEFNNTDLTDILTEVTGWF